MEKPKWSNSDEGLNNAVHYQIESFEGHPVKPTLDKLKQAAALLEDLEKDMRDITYIHAGYIDAAEKIMSTLNPINAAIEAARKDLKESNYRSLIKLLQLLSVYSNTWIERKVNTEVLEENEKSIAENKRQYEAMKEIVLRLKAKLKETEFELREEIRKYADRN